MAELPTEITSLLIPMQGRPWLLPNIILAEVLPLRQPDRPGHGSEWLLGWLNWRDVDLPLLSFERLNESGQVVIGEEARIAVLNSITGKTGFYAVIVQGIPRQVRVNSDDLIEEPVETGPAEAMYIQLGGDLAVIPDLDAIEQAVAGLHGRS
ncbi:chemotaxis protein CheW [Alcanivorax quisquiliarum]|uniref:Chemotaxis protein CheW n=1 Tax=Alcanivorax quisquiliarum TaxID=2933565 RepID=A0ABT0E4R9_9GAMM|nr:chemotaxis protein CheW [Alcanivorax quisquiliarum]MCK0536818.1 chemotaxis protein CheW [Alcanivorax quisquiliarum]